VLYNVKLNKAIVGILLILCSLVTWLFFSGENTPPQISELNQAETHLQEDTPEQVEVAGESTAERGELSDLAAGNQSSAGGFSISFKLSDGTAAFPTSIRGQIGAQMVEVHRAPEKTLCTTEMSEQALLLSAKFDNHAGWIGEFPSAAGYHEVTLSEGAVLAGHIKYPHPRIFSMPQFWASGEEVLPVALANSDTTPSAELLKFATDTDMQSFKLAIDENGDFRILGLAENWRGLIRMNSSNLRWVDPDVQADSYSSTFQIEWPREDLYINLEENPFIWGRFVDENSTGLSNSGVNYQLKTKSGGGTRSRGGSDQCDEEGIFRIVQPEDLKSSSISLGIDNDDYFFETLIIKPIPEDGYLGDLVCLKKRKLELIVRGNGETLKEINCFVEGSSNDAHKQTIDDKLVLGLPPYACQIKVSSMGFISKELLIPVDQVSPLEIDLERAYSIEVALIDSNPTPKNPDDRWANPFSNFEIELSGDGGITIPNSLGSRFIRGGSSSSYSSGEDNAITRMSATPRREKYLERFQMNLAIP